MWSHFPMKCCHKPVCNVNIISSGIIVHDILAIYDTFSCLICIVYTCYTCVNPPHVSHCTDEWSSESPTHLSEGKTWERQNTRLSCLVTKNKGGRNKDTIIPVWRPPSCHPFNPLLFLQKSELHPIPSVSCHPLKHTTEANFPIRASSTWHRDPQQAVLMGDVGFLVWTMGQII